MRPAAEALAEGPCTRRAHSTSVASHGPSIEPERTRAEIDAGELPWGYGENRITVIVRDPDSAYLYWEIDDEGIAAARSRLGPAGTRGWCNLRIYDTTGREFDGTNANDYFDLRSIAQTASTTS